jgi:thiamine transport system ATP-binding protein
VSSVVLEGVGFRYQAMAMSFDLAVEEGEWLAVIGPSGAGKSTLLNLVAGFETPRAGRVLIGGADMASLPPAARPVTTLFQDHNLFPHLTVLRNVGLGLDPRLRLTAADRARIGAALAELGLAGLEERLPGQLSGGERQRVALARALVRAKPVLLLDEPFAALGPGQKKELLQQVQRLRRARGLTIVMVTHDVGDVRNGPDRVCFVAAGRVLAVAAPGELLARRDLPELAEYLGE